MKQIAEIELLPCPMCQRGEPCADNTKLVSDQLSAALSRVAELGAFVRSLDSFEGERFIGGYQTLDFQTERRFLIIDKDSRDKILAAGADALDAFNAMKEKG